MRLPRVSVAGLMVVIMIVAVNCAVIRAFRYHPPYEGEVLPVWFASQFGLYRMAHTRGRARVFWAGFCGSCLVTCLILLSRGVCYWSSSAVAQRYALLIIIHMQNYWDLIFYDLAGNLLPTGVFKYFDDRQPTARSIAFSLPQLLIAVAIALLVRQLTPGKTTEEQVNQPASESDMFRL